MSFTRDEIDRIPATYGVVGLFRTTTADDFGLLLMSHEPDTLREVALALPDAYPDRFDPGMLWSAQMEGVKEQKTDKPGYEHFYHILLPLAPTVQHFHEAVRTFAEDVDADNPDATKSYLGQAGLDVHLTVKSPIKAVIHRAHEMATKGWFSELFSGVNPLQAITPDVIRMPLSAVGMRGIRPHNRAV